MKYEELRRVLAQDVCVRERELKGENRPITRPNKKQTETQQVQIQCWCESYIYLILNEGCQSLNCDYQNICVCLHNIYVCAVLINFVFLNTLIDKFRKNKNEYMFLFNLNYWSI